MTSLTSQTFLNHLKTIYPSQGGKVLPVLRNPWYLITAVALSASNTPEAVPAVFRFALENLRKETPHSGVVPAIDHELALARRFRECLLQSGLLSGYARVG